MIRHDSTCGLPSHKFASYGTCNSPQYNMVPAFLAAIKQCSNKGDLEEGKRLHLDIAEAGLHTRRNIANSLITMYSKCGSMFLAREIFESMSYRDVVSWTSLIMGYAENGEALVALQLFGEMDCEPDSVTYVSATKACTCLFTDNHLDRLFCLSKGMEVHRKAREDGFDKELIVGSNLVDMYSKCGSIRHARAVFDNMVLRNVVSWTSLIAGYVENGQNLVALELFTRMDAEPNSLTLAAVLKACASELCLEKGMAIHSEARERGFHTHTHLVNNLMAMYSKCGSVLDAHAVFEDTTIHRNAVLWTTLMLGYVENGEDSVAMELFRNMECEPDCIAFVIALKACTGLAAEHQSDRHLCLEVAMAIHKQAKQLGFEQNAFIETSLVDIYTKCKCMRDARAVFDKMAHRNVVSYTTLILGYVEEGENLVAIDLFMSMDCVPDDVTFVAVLKACGNGVEVTAGRAIHALLCKLGLEQDRSVTTTILDFYGKCGNMVTAQHVFNSMQSPDIVAWNALVAGYTSIGDTSQVFSLVKCVKEAGVKLSSVTFLLLLTSCSHAGMVELGKEYFESMYRYGILPNMEHYTCMVDMLGRANRLQEALSFITSMPFESGSGVWRALLGACKNWNNVEVGKVAFDALVARQKKDGSAYVLMGDMYKKLGMQQTWKET